MKTKKEIIAFKRKIWGYYKTHKREFVWRNTTDPYKILVSEVMLQQTQVSRVKEKYPLFLKAFPTLGALAKAPLSDVLKAWQGMGYNRRAMMLKRTAEEVTKDWGGKLPNTFEELTTLPGIGQSTAGAVVAFAYGKPSVFIETNIRRVFIHFFFKNKTKISDDDIRPLIEASVSTQKPRDWYYALMDYGVKLAKEEKKNPNQRSKHYTKQSTFEGSNRQVRGNILKLLVKHEKATEVLLRKNIKRPKEKVKEILDSLLKEGFIKKEGRVYTLV